MYKIFFLFFVSLLSAQRECRLSFSNKPFLQDGKIVFMIRNLNENKIKVPTDYGSDWARPTEIQVYNDEKKMYEDTGYEFDGTTCLKMKDCFGKMISLKKGQYKVYEVKIIPGRILSAFKKNEKYRFKLSFNTYLFSSCYDYVTDWLYYQN